MNNHHNIDALNIETMLMNRVCDDFDVRRSSNNR